VSDGGIENPKPNSTHPFRVEAQEARPFAYRALCKIAGILTILGALPALAASILGLFALMTRPDTPAWAYALMAAIGGFAFVLIGLGSQILKERVWAAAAVALLDCCFTAWNLSNGRTIPAAISSLLAVLCLAVVIAAWRLDRVDH
jgi:hypothetical protein